jgi:hypothetical protein
MKKNFLWWFGNVVATVIGGLVGGHHGLPIGFAVGYALLLLVDIRYESEQKWQTLTATVQLQTPPTQPTTCTWTQSTDPSMPDTYHAPCGVAWTFTEGGPVENDMHFCPKCGNHITQKGADHEPV